MPPYKLDPDVDGLYQDFGLLPAKGLPEDIGLDYEPPRPPVTVKPTAKVTIARVPHTHCSVCSAPLPPTACPSTRTCGGECQAAHRRAKRKEYRDGRYRYQCEGCSERFEVGYSMWLEVRSRGMLCSKCHTANAEVVLGEEGPEDLTRQAPCPQCAHARPEPAAYSGFMCLANARVCAPRVHAQLFVARNRRLVRG